MNALQLAVNQILFPPGRIVQGDLYEAQDKDMQGNPLLIKNGPNAGKPRVNFFFAYAIPKTRAAWWEEGAGTDNPWGARILQIANTAWPQGQTQNPRFAWKIEDGDSQVPNEAGRKNCDREGHPGHWILKFGSSFPTKIVDEQGAPMAQPGLVKRGFYVEVLGTVTSNEQTSKPGLYLNHQIVAYRAPGKEIMIGPDPRAVGFGRAALPAGVTAAPLGAAANMPTVPGAPPSLPQTAPPVSSPVVAPPAGIPPIPGTVAAPPPAVMPPPAAPVAVAPNPAFLTPGGAALPPAGAAAPPPPPAAAAPPAPPAAPALDPLGAPSGYRMANQAGPRYESYRQQGWTDAQLVQQGVMVRL